MIFLYSFWYYNILLGKWAKFAIIRNMILKGKKVVLRPVKLSDAERFVKWFNDSTVNKFLNIRRLTLKDEIKYIKERLKNKSKDKISLCIDSKEGEHIGNCALEDINLDYRRATFGIMIGNKDFWNKGYGTEAAKLLLNYGFSKLKLHRIDLDVYEYNARAFKVYRKLGFKKEGVKREYTKLNGKYFNAFSMSILESEWTKLK